MSEASNEGRLAWPPIKEDLERLYLDQKLSAAKIAKVYGLKYKSEKVAESAVLHELKKNGIKRRDRADHVRKFTEVMVDEWVRRYNAGESLKKIAGNEISPVSIYLHLRKRRVQLRDKLEAQITAVTKYERKPFYGDSIEKAYLMGLRYGDLDAVRHGRAIRVRVSTTHPAMAELFEVLFSPYAHVHRYPRKAKLVPYEWTLECDLSPSFEFLLDKPSISELESLDDRLFLAFLAGFFDAEGSVIMRQKRGRYATEIAISNSDESLIDFLFRRLRRLGFSAHTQWIKQRVDRGRITGESTAGSIRIWKYKEVQEFLRTVNFRHREKTAKSDLVREIDLGKDPSEIFRRWVELKGYIRLEREIFLQEAEKVLSARKEDVSTI